MGHIILGYQRISMAYFHYRIQNFGYKEDLEKHERTERHLVAEVARMSDPFRKLATKGVFNCDICQKVKFSLEGIHEYRILISELWISRRFR